MIRPSAALSSAAQLARRSRGRVSQRPYHWAALVLVVLLVATSVATSYTVNVQRDDQRDRIGRDAQLTLEGFDRRIDAYSDVLVALRGFFEVERAPSRTSFQRFVRSMQIEKRFPGVRAVTFARTEGRPGSGGRRTIVTRVEPLAGNQAVLGFDQLGDPVRAGAIATAQRTGRPAATAPLQLVQEARRRKGFVVVLGVRRGDAVATRRARVAGVVSAAFDTTTLVDAILGPGGRDFDLEVYDMGAAGAAGSAAPARANLIYGQGPTDGSTRVADGRHSVLRPLHVAGRRWLVYYAPRGAAAVPVGPNQWIVAVGGTLGSLLAAWLFLTLARGRTRALALANRITSELEHSERRTRDILETAPDAIVGIEQSGAIVLVNAQVERVFGYERDELIGQPIEVLIPDRFHGAHVGHRGGYFAEPGTRPMGAGLTLYARRKDGSEFPAEISLSSIETADGLLATAAVRDVTERERMEAELRRSSRYFDLSRDLVCTATIGGSFEQVNARWTATLGWTEKELRERPFLDFVHPDDLEATRQRIARLRRGEDHDPFVNRYATRDGGWRWLEWNAIVAPGEDLIYASARDITERALTEAALAASERQTRQILETAHDAFVAMDAAGRIQAWNSQAEATFGWDADDVIGESLADTIIPERHREAHRRGLERFLTTGETHMLGQLVELTALHRDGREFPVEITISPLKSGGGYVFNAFIRDITERTRTQEQLALAHQQAVQASRMKSDFVANMSHEIRTPLNGVIGLTGLLLATDLNEEQRDYAESVQASGDALMGVISDILDFSKIEAGKLELDDHAFALHEIVDGVSAMLAMESHEKGLELMVWVDEDVPNDVRGDGPRIRQVLANLATNAVKFTHAGEVVMRVTLDSKGVGRDGEPDDDGLVVRFAVTDTGIGIEPQTADGIFDSFSQADTSTTREYGGTGLGLAISKQLVALMGGRIGLESTPDSGSTFWFTVPVARARSAESERAPRRTNFAEIRVLVVDDNATSRTILEHKLTSLGVNCDGAAEPEDALCMLRDAVADGRPYALALLDFTLRGMGGLELARRVQDEPELASTRLMMLSSSGAEREAAAQAGVHGFVTKPVRGTRLAQEMARALGAGQLVPMVDAAMRAPTATRPLPTNGRLVLVAEDKSVNQLVAVRMLEKLGFRAEIATNGREAVALHASGRYEAIFMDCQMPELDGYQATAAIRRREAGESHTPIIAMTAHTLRGDRERCLQAGMDDYVAKPIRTADLADAIARALDQAEPDARFNGSPPAAHGEAPLVDATRLQDVFGDDIEARTQLLDRFLVQSGETLAALAEPVAAGDAPAVARLAHGLKGSAAVVGAERLSQLAAQLSDDAAEGRLDGAGRLYDALQSTLDATDRALKATASE